MKPLASILLTMLLAACNPLHLVYSPDEIAAMQRIVKENPPVLDTLHWHSHEPDHEHGHGHGHCTGFECQHYEQGRCVRFECQR